MRNLNLELKQLCRRNRVCSYSAQRGRERVVDQVASKPQAQTRRRAGGAMAN